MEETGESIRKELKKAFRMEVDISTKELMNKHERLAKEVCYNLCHVGIITLSPQVFYSVENFNKQKK